MSSPKDFTFNLRRKIDLRFKLEMTREQSAAFWSALAPLAKQRACRTCDYGDSPDCGHESRAERVCAAPVGTFDCAVVPCLGSCATARPVSRWCERCEGEVTRGQAYETLPGTGGHVVHIHCPDGGA